MKKTKHECHCGEPGTEKGTIYRLVNSARNGLKAEHRWMCQRHYLENTFGLWPYTCTKTCEKARRNASECYQLSDLELLTWISLTVVESTEKMRPGCPWCTRKLRSWQGK